MNDTQSAASFMNWPCALTALNIAGGFMALILASQGDIGWAAGVVVACGVLDSLDGLVARKLSMCSPFGAQLDSLADIVAFGVAPALMLYVGALESITFAGLAAAVAFVLCGAWRLARFALIADDHRFVGLPIPPAAVIAACTVAWAPPPLLALGVTVTLCALMVSDIPFPTFRTIARILRSGSDEEEAAAAVMDVDLDGGALSGSTSSPQRG